MIILIMTNIMIIVPMADDRRPAKGKQSGPEESECFIPYHVYDIIVYDSIVWYMIPLILHYII